MPLMHYTYYLDNMLAHLQMIGQPDIQKAYLKEGPAKARKLMATGDAAPVFAPKEPIPAAPSGKGAITSKRDNQAKGQRQAPTFPVKPGRHSKSEDLSLGLALLVALWRPTTTSVSRSTAVTGVSSRTGLWRKWRRRRTMGWKVLSTVTSSVVVR